jgi:predicted transcriptional regulator
MSTRLNAAIEAPEIVRALKPFGVTQEQIAAVVHVSPRAVRAWNLSSPRPEHYDRLAEFRDLVSLLSDSLTERGVKQWLSAKNRMLQGSRPIDLLAEGNFAMVEAAAQAFVDGAYV